MSNESDVVVEVRLPATVMGEYEMVAKLAGVPIASVVAVALAQEVRRQQWAAVVLVGEAGGEGRE